MWFTHVFNKYGYYICSINIRNSFTGELNYRDDIIQGLIRKDFIEMCPPEGVKFYDTPNKLQDKKVHISNTFNAAIHVYSGDTIIMTVCDLDLLFGKTDKFSDSTYLSHSLTHIGELCLLNAHIITFLKD